MHWQSKRGCALFYMSAFRRRDSNASDGCQSFRGTDAQSRSKRRRAYGKAKYAEGAQSDPARPIRWARQAIAPGEDIPALRLKFDMRAAATGIESHAVDYARPPFGGTGSAGRETLVALRSGCDSQARQNKPARQRSQFPQRLKHAESQRRHVIHVLSRSVPPRRRF